MVQMIAVHTTPARNRAAIETNGLHVSAPRATGPVYLGGQPAGIYLVALGGGRWPIPGKTIVSFLVDVAGIQLAEDPIAGDVMDALVALSPIPPDRILTCIDDPAADMTNPLLPRHNDRRP